MPQRQEPGVSIARCSRFFSAAMCSHVHCLFSTIDQAPFEIHRQCAATWGISLSSWSPWHRGDRSEPFATKQQLCLKEYSNSGGNFIFQRAWGLSRSNSYSKTCGKERMTRGIPETRVSPAGTLADWLMSLWRAVTSGARPPQWAVQLKMLSNDVLPRNDNGLRGASL